MANSSDPAVYLYRSYKITLKCFQLLLYCLKSFTHGLKLNMRWYKVRTYKQI
jgi:hypothetical protein